MLLSKLKEKKEPGTIAMVPSGTDEIVYTKALTEASHNN